MFTTLKSKVTRRLQKVAGDFLNNSLQSKYEELGAVASEAVKVGYEYLIANNVDEDLYIHVDEQGNQDIGYLLGFYKRSNEFMMFSYTRRYNQSEEWGDLLNLTWGLLHWCDKWTNSLTDQFNRDMAESAVRDHAIAILQFVETHKESAPS